MTPLPPSSTARLEFDYDTCGYGHTVQVRLSEATTPADGVDAFQSLVAALSPAMFPGVVTGVRLAESGSNIFNPYSDSFDISWGSGSPQAYHTAWYYDFVGRSLDGRKVRIALFGAQSIEYGGNYRITLGELAAINDAWSVLAGATGVFVSINGFQPVWHRYANCGANAYWRNKVR